MGVFPKNDSHFNTTFNYSPRASRRAAARARITSRALWVPDAAAGAGATETTAGAAIATKLSAPTSGLSIPIDEAAASCVATDSWGTCHIN